jgi:hypothetical protein
MKVSPSFSNGTKLGPGLRRGGMLVFGAVLTACHSQPTQPAANATPSSLEVAAIAAGVIDDPSTIDPTGLYARDRDKLCVVPSATAFRVGVYIDYGDGYSCSGSGEATRAGETLHVELTSAPGCAFDATFDGERIAVPGRLPDACQRACTSRASLAGLSVEKLSDSPSEAGALRDGRGRLLCGAAR